jgi:uncharacterized protein (TIGR00730 family)
MADFRVTVYCGSSRQCDPAYLDAASRLGRELARQKATLVYGGGAAGVMGALADGALEEGGRVIGVLPRFMKELEWGHPRLTELLLVGDLHERKRRMLEGANAVVALPGGSGTFEELLEAITWKRLALYLGPIVLLNTLSFFDRLVSALEHSIAERFMDPRHGEMWTVVAEPEDVIRAIHAAPPWNPEALKFASL